MSSNPLNMPIVFKHSVSNAPDSTTSYANHSSYRKSSTTKTMAHVIRKWKTDRENSLEDKLYADTLRAPVVSVSR